MKRKTTKLLCLLISLIMPLGVLSSCVTPPPDDQTKEPSTNTNTDNVPDTESVESESGKTGTDETRSDETTSEGTEAGETETDEAETETPAPSIEHIENGNSIEYANDIANAVQAYYYDNRAHMAVSNGEMEYVYSLKKADSYTVEAIKSSKGKAYIENTADMFIRMTNGMTYYSSLSNVSPSTNINRLGYYFYEVQYKGQNFGGDVSLADKEISIPLTSLTANQMQSKKGDGEKKFIISNITDPFITVPDIAADTAKYNYLQLEMKIEAPDLDVQSVTVTVFVASGANGFDGARTVNFPAYTDGEYHTYLVPISLVSGYEGTLNKVRIDFNTPLRVKDTVFIKEVSILPVDDEYMPIKASVSRKFFVYSDKLHHTAQFVTTADIKNVAEIGMLTRIDADTVDKILIKDAKGTHDKLEGVDWSSVEAVGFDITDVGIFGYILPVHEAAGTLKVTLTDNAYVIEQTRAVKSNSLVPSLPNTGNANDLYLGQRIYTDENHSFDEFLFETYCERNPLTSLEITSDASSKSRFNGYDALRGIYDLELLTSSAGWAAQFNSYQNQHLNIHFAVESGEADRKIYVMCNSKREALESGALLNGSNLLLPIPLQLTKNFSEGNANVNERDIYDLDDATFSEAIFPLDLKKGERNSYNIVMANEFWGNYPLKQLSSIRFSHPYYHLSTGINESNCITPWSNATLPDHRAMSSPFTHDNTQHTSGGQHVWLNYTAKNGEAVSTENVKNTITSSGNTYAEVYMDYLSNDGSIEVTYSHMEFPSRDETRTFYTMEYKVLKDISFKDFKNEFQFFSLTDNHAGHGVYHNIGYLDKNNEYATADALFTEGGSQSFILGDNCPYFSYYNMNGRYNASTNPTGYEPHDGDGYVNLAFLVYNYEFTINGKKITPNFIITEKDHTIYLSLDLGELSLKAGDTFSINSILLPWGSQELDGKYDTYKDQNARDVREKTLLNPLTATPVADCEAIESVFVPKVRSTNGKSAEFTISGGQDNIAIRVYGFEALTAPKLYEKIDEEWVLVDLYSANNPDKNGYAHYYDGYAVYYDGDGTFSYSFVTKMDNGAPRTFKLEAYEEFTQWPEIALPEEISPFNAYLDASDLYLKLQIDNPSIVTYAMAEDDSYVSIYGTPEYGAKGATEYYFHVGAKSDIPAGQYIVLKYRIPEDNAEKLGAMMFYSSTTEHINTGKSCVTVRGEAYKADGKWHVLVVDATCMGLFTPDENGLYSPLHYRINVFLQKNVSAGTRVDYAYTGFHDSLDEIKAFVANDPDGVDTIDYVDDHKNYSALTIE